MTGIKEVRNVSYISYDLDILLFTVIMKNVSGRISMNKMTRDFNTEIPIESIAKALGYEALDEIPHYDIINNLFKKLESNELDKIRDYMIRKLFKKRFLEKYRMLDKYWCIAIDGTQGASFD